MSQKKARKSKRESRIEGTIEKNNKLVFLNPNILIKYKWSNQTD